MRVVLSLLFILFSAVDASASAAVKDVVLHEQTYKKLSFCIEKKTADQKSVKYKGGLWLTPQDYNDYQKMTDELQELMDAGFNLQCLKNPKALEKGIGNSKTIAQLEALHNKRRELRDLVASFGSKQEAVTFTKKKFKNLKVEFKEKYPGMKVRESSIDGFAFARNVLTGLIVDNTIYYLAPEDQYILSALQDHTGEECFDAQDCTWELLQMFAFEAVMETIEKIAISRMPYDPADLFHPPSIFRLYKNSPVALKEAYENKECLPFFAAVQEKGGAHCRCIQFRSKRKQRLTTTAHFSLFTVLA